jgi:membrane protease YdiL (CAAX protease family)
MTGEHETASLLKTWFIGPDGRVRPIWRVVTFVVLAILLNNVVQGLLFALSAHRAVRAGMFVQSAAIGAAWLLLSWLLLWVLDRRSFRTLGLWFFRGWARELVLGAGIGAGLIIAVVVVQAALGAVRYVGVTANPAAAVRTVGYLAALFLAAAAAEEIAFRGYGFQRLVDATGRVAAIGVFSAVFGLVHLSNPSATLLSTANTVLAGVLLAVAYLKTRALWLPIGLHWGWNFFMNAVLSLPVSGFQFGEQPFRVEMYGPAWLSGGRYGPEGSVVLTVLCVAAIVALARTPRISPSAEMAAILKSGNA